MKRPKRFVIPAFFVVEAPTKGVADDQVMRIQQEVNKDNFKTGNSLYLDEKVPTVRIPDNWETVYTVMDVVNLLLENTDG